MSDQTVSFGAMSPDIPPFNEQGHLPPGRYCVTLEQVKERFVDHPDFADSLTRASRWEGLLDYLELWAEVEGRVEHILEGTTLLKCLWLGGSFISSKVNPGNVDLSVFLDGDSLLICKQNGQSERMTRLAGRRRMNEKYHVAPSLIAYRYVRSPWTMYRDSPAYEAPYTGEHFRYAGQRGIFDDWWQRMRPPEEDKGAPDPDTGRWARGYVEVML